MCFPRCPGPAPLGRCSGPPVCTLCVWCCVYGVLGLLAPVHRCARSVRGVACTASRASWLLFTAVHALCAVLRARLPGSCSPACTLCVWCCGCGVLCRLVPTHRRVRSPCVVACAVSWATWLLFTGVPVCVLCSVFGYKSSCHSCPALHRRTGPVAPRDNHSLAEGHWIFTVYCLAYGFLCLGALCRVYGVLGPLAPVHRCARVVCGVVCAASWASWLLFTGARARCALLACFLSPSLILACSCACSP